MSSLEFEPPKYARVVLEVRRRIENGDYPPGSLLPSESQLVREFAVGRTTVVRALQMLQQDGWITREHGRGSFVKGRPGPAGARPSRRGLALLDRPETQAGVSLVDVGQVEAPAEVAALLGLDGGVRVLARRSLTVRDEVASEVVTCWFPPELVFGTDLDKPGPLPVGVRAHLRTVKGLRVDHISERLSARRPAGDEARLLRIGKSEPVLVVLAGMHDASDAVRFVAEVVMPGSLHELEDVYSVPD